MKKILLTMIVLVLFVTFVQAQTNYALSFNGSSNYCQITDNSIDLSSDFTVECWAKFNNLGTFEYIIVKNDQPSTAHAYTLECGVYKDTDNKIHFIIGSSTAWAWHRVSGTSTVNTSAWYHIAAVIQSTTMSIYINGVLEGTAGHTDARRSDLNSANVYLGCDLNGSGNPANFLNGKLDEVRIWNTARTEAQIKSNMFKEISVSLSAYYKMSDGSGTSLTDNSGNGNAGSLTSGPAWIASGAFADCRNALDFDGADDYINCGNNASLQRNGTQNLTLEAWVKPIGGFWGTVVSKFVHTASAEGYSLEIFSDNRPCLLFGNNWSDWNAATSSIALSTGVWNHIAATYDGSTIKIYVNGALTQSIAWTNGCTDSGTDLLLGSRSGTTFFPGQIDEVRVWSVARTAEQIREDMCKTLTGNEAGLSAYYRLDQIDGLTTYDPTSNANNGTLTNMDPSTDWVSSDAFDTWIGAESSLWSDAANWSKGAIPASSNSVGIYKWNLGNEAIIGGSPTVNNLFISSTAAPALSSAITINMNLLLGKNFDLNGQTVTLGGTGNLVEGTYRLYGASGTITTTRTLNNISSLDAAGLGAKITTSANMGSTTITRGHTEQTGNGNVSSLRYYNITPTNNSSLNATLVFNYYEAELNGITEADLRLFKSTDSGTNWTNEGGIVSAANNYVTKTGVPSFSRWTLASSAAPLTGPPDSPAAYGASDITHTGFNANWGASVLATGYYLDVALDIGFTNFVAGFNNINVGNVTTYSVTGIAAGTNYYYRLRAFNAGGISSNSDTIMVALGLPAPVATIVTTYTPTGFTANWEASSGALGYLLDAATDAAFTNILAGYNNKDVGNVTSYLINGRFTPGTIYFYRVRSYNNSVTSSYSNTISFTMSELTPKLTNIESNPLVYTEGSDTVQITKTIVVSDADDSNLESAFVQIIGNYRSGEDELSFVNKSGITGSWNASDGKITLSGSALLADYQAALRAVKYKNTSGDPSTLQRTISFAVNDGDSNSDTLMRTVNISNVDSPPLLTSIENSSLSYTEGSDTVQITKTIVVSDADDSNIESAFVQIIGNYRNGEDELSFVNKSGITGAWDASNGKITLNGSALLADYQAALRAVKYKNTSGDPSTLQRTISFAVNDGFSNSDTLTRQISIVTATGTRELSGNLPKEFYLGQNYPNPFNPTTTIQYGIPAAGVVQLKVYNMLGCEVAILVNRYMSSGVYEVEFNGVNLSSGIYFYEITSNKFSQIKKMIFLK